MSFLESNLFQLTATAAAGGALWIVTRWFSSLIKIVSYALALGIIFSALLNVGEVYVYSEYYRRAFFYYSDEITTVLIFLFFYFFIKRDMALSFILLTSIIVSGGKISIIIFIIFTLFFFSVNWSYCGVRLKSFFSYLLAGLLGYAVVVVISLHIEPYGAGGFAGNNACRTVETCVETQIENTLRQRYFSAVAGVWMTIEGGFRGERYPETPEKFADLMMEADPWGINERYHLTREYWRKIGGVQPPYPAFGAGYGPWMLGGLLALFLVIGMGAVANLRRGARNEASLYAIFFLINVTCNQTQSWLNSGSMVLALTGACATQIIVSIMLRRSLKLTRRVVIVRRRYRRWRSRLLEDTWSVGDAKLFFRYAATARSKSRGRIGP